MERKDGAVVSEGGGGTRRELTVRRADGLYPSIQMIEDERQQEPSAV